MSSSLLPSLSAVYDALFNFAQSDGFWANLETAFGTNYDVIKATELRQQWQSRVFQSAEVQKLWVLGKRHSCKRQKGRKIGVPH